MPQYQNRCTPREGGDFLRGYLDAAEWLLPDEFREAFELSVSPKWSPESIAAATRDCDAFREAVGWDALGFDDYQGGIDFFLTRNGHGAGYWDGDYPEPHDTTLTDAAHPYGETHEHFDASAEVLHTCA